MRQEKKCLSLACNNTVLARGLCRKHYMRWWVHGNAETVLIKQPKAGAPQAFIDALQMTGQGCVIWPFTKNNMGYAQINIPRSGGKKLLVSRVVCERVHGPAPTPDHVSAHECGNGHNSCVAPWHLFWKTRTENSADMVMHGTLRHGNNSPRAKLTSSQVVAIRNMDGFMPQSKIAELYGVSQSAISLILRGKNWKHLERAA